MPRSDEVDISTGQGSGTGIDVGIGAGGMDGGFIEAMAQELDNAANNVGSGHPDWGMSGSASPMSAEQAVANINAAGGQGGGVGWNNPNEVMETAPNITNQMMQDGSSSTPALDQDLMNQQEGVSGNLSDMLSKQLTQNESPIDASQAGEDVSSFLGAAQAAKTATGGGAGWVDPNATGPSISAEQAADAATGGGEGWVNPNASFEELEAQFSTSPQVDPRAGTQHGFQTRALDEGISPPQINQSSSDEEKLAAVQQKSAETGEDPTSIIGKILSGVMQFIPGMGIVKALTGGLPQSNIPTFHGGFQKLPDGGGWDWFGDPRIKGSFMGMPYGPPKQIDRTSPEWLLYGSEPDGPNPFFQKYPWLQQLPQRVINRAVEDGEFLRELIRAQEADELWLYMSEQ